MGHYRRLSHVSARPLEEPAFSTRFLRQCKTQGLFLVSSPNDNECARRQLFGVMLVVWQDCLLRRLVVFESTKGLEAPAKWQDDGQGGDQNGEPNSEEEPETEKFGQEE